MILLDTSVWIEAFRRPSRIDLGDALDLDEVVVCPPVVQEVLQGFRDENAYRVARESLLSFPCVESPMPIATFTSAADLYRAARRSGITVRSSVDCLIAACAIRHSLTLVHSDRDFAELARVAPLAERELRW